MNARQQVQTGDHPDDQATPAKGPGNVTFWTIVRSTLAAAIGVQNRANRERDFEHGTPGAFIAAGVIFTVIFVAVLLGVVYVVIRSAAG
ncbi:MAG: DUF2970 domain-containing protein [Gammaproteobacteria bacterium]|nr:DUF2970 domain-containing protein [Gammaproteobacteria bacterium]